MAFSCAQAVYTNYTFGIWAWHLLNQIFGGKSDICHNVTQIIHLVPNDIKSVLHVARSSRSRCRSMRRSSLWWEAAGCTAAGIAPARETTASAGRYCKHTLLYQLIINSPSPTWTKRHIYEAQQWDATGWIDQNNNKKTFKPVFYDVVMKWSLTHKSEDKNKK